MRLIRRRFSVAQTISKDSANKFVVERIKNSHNYLYTQGRLFPSEFRNDFYAVNLFFLEMQKIVFEARDIAVGKGKLDFWTETIDKLYSGIAVQEPISIALMEAIEKNKLPKTCFKDILQVHKLQNERIQENTLSDFVNNVRKCYTALFILNLYLLRVPVIFDQHMEFIELMENVAVSIGITDQLKRVPFDLKMYKLRLPADICDKYSVNVRNLWDRIHGKPKEEFGDLVLE